MATQAKQRLLTTAEELFYAEGIRAVGIDRLLQESGVGRASFYRHFASKDDLVVAVLEDRDHRWLDWLRTSVESVDDSAARPLAVFTALAERLARNDFRGCAFINTMIEMADPASPAHQVADRHKRRVITYLTELLTAADQPDPDILATELALLIDGAIVTAVRENSPAAADRAAAIAARLLA
ncbi:TetR/AcrR family transcriptional regulator [Nocardia rhizosphaerihabitans]|uniref:TetR family transcriptional regulator n=1 Tax=Nocardia rhizosphaerihabitans TaxID=1691570 RepID=A0ABQ2KNR2_9NOCA|nr:TetR family transcriptional regulator [Nocardia rhizosphaerihabitans]GGN88793.1 TetR family transcriptional regulator [Nocardia rhizosphaerihabitans]